MSDINNIKYNNTYLERAVDGFLKVKQLHMKITTIVMSCVDPKTMQESAKNTDFTACLNLIDEVENILDDVQDNINRINWGKDRLNLQREWNRLTKTNNILTKKIKTIIKNQQFARLNDVPEINVVQTFFKSQIDIKQFARIFTAGAEQNAIAAAAREREAEHKAKEAEQNAIAAAAREREAEHKAKEAEQNAIAAKLRQQEAAEFKNAKKVEAQIIADRSAEESLKLAECIRAKDAQIVADARAAIEMARCALADAIAADDAQQIAAQSEIIKQKSHAIEKFAGSKHKQFDDVFKDIAQNIAPMLVGPAGSGKSTILQQCADAMYLQYYPLSVNGQTSEYQIVGYKNANGEYVRSAFRDAYEHGGLFSFEEIDAGNPNVLTVMNNALSQDFYLFPDGVVKKHHNFRLAASANTYGRGATRQYIGRNAIDAATLDRFAMTYVYYDEDLEMQIGPEPKWTKNIQSIRHVVESLQMPLIVSTRAVVLGGRDVLSGTSWDVALGKFVWRGCNSSDISKVMNLLNGQKKR